MQTFGRHQLPRGEVRPATRGSPRRAASVDPIIGETESIAREKAYNNELVDPEVALALVSTHIGVDLSKYPIDQPLQNIESSDN